MKDFLKTHLSPDNWIPLGFLLFSLSSVVALFAPSTMPYIFAGSMFLANLLMFLSMESPTVDLFKNFMTKVTGIKFE